MSSDDQKKQPNWIRAQIKAFSGWINSNIAKDIQINNLLTDLSDGTVLIALLDSLEKQKIIKRFNVTAKCKLKIRRIENIRQCFQFLEKQRQFNLTGITAPG